MRQLGLTFYLLRAALVVALATCTACVLPSRQQRQRAFDERQARLEAQRRGDRAWRTRDKPRITTPTIMAYRELGTEVGARPVRIDAPCVNAKCTRRVLGRLFEKLDRIDGDRQGVARILVLGDSHIAADYITRTVRDRLQHRFGDAGRGFIAIDQKAQYGGRRLNRVNWNRTRVVDGNGAGQRFGFAGMRLDSARGGARLTFELLPSDDDVVAYYRTGPESPTITFLAQNHEIARLETSTEEIESRSFHVAIPETVGGSAYPPGRLDIVAAGPGAGLMGLSFESYEAGVILDAVGPVGADATVYLSMEPESLEQHLRHLDPDLVMLMIGGNDALAVRKGDRTLAQVERDHLELIKRLKEALPNADCLLWSPLDAGVRDGKKIESKANLVEVRDLQRKVAAKMRCAFWDTYEAMGGKGSFARWYDKGLMNKDLVHPRSRGGDLLGHLFSTSLINAYLNGK